MHTKSKTAVKIMGLLQKKGKSNGKTTLPDTKKLEKEQKKKLKNERTGLSKTANETAQKKWFKQEKKANTNKTSIPSTVAKHSRTLPKWAKIPKIPAFSNKNENQSNDPSVHPRRWRGLNPAKSVGIKLFLIFFIAIMLLVVSLGTFSYLIAKSIIKENAAVGNEQTIIQTGEKLDVILGQLVNSSTQIFFDPNMQEELVNLSKPGIDDFDKFQAVNAITSNLQNQLNSLDSIDSIYIVPMNKDVNVVGAGVQIPAADDVRNTAWYKELESGNGVMQWVPTMEMQGTVKNFLFARAVRTTNTSDSFVFVISANSKLIEDQIANVNMGTGGRVDLIGGASNTVIASTNDADIAKPSNYSFLPQLTEKSGRVENSAGQSPILIAYSTLQNSDWKLVGTVPINELVSSAKPILNMTLLFAVIDAVFAVLIGIFIIRIIAKPLQNLQQLMRQGAQGKLNVRTTHKSEDEIGQLGAAFNEMMENITNLVKQTNQSAQEVLGTATILSNASKQTATSAKEIAVATEEIANGAGSLALEAERGTELADGIMGQMNKVISANNEMGASAHDVEQASETGVQHMEKLLTRTQTTEDMIRSLGARIDSLQESTSSVQQVLEVMQNITKQTNILSLNATIEAARAGAAGKGFMVVADEVRKLAEQSRESILMVGKITTNIQQEMEETIKVLNDAYPLFKQQTEAVKDTTTIFESVQGQMSAFVTKLNSVTDSINDLSQVQNTMSEAMSNVSAVAEQSSATSQEVASLSNEQHNVSSQLVSLSGQLENVSLDLKETISRFTVEEDEADTLQASIDPLTEVNEAQDVQQEEQPSTHVEVDPEQPATTNAEADEDTDQDADQGTDSDKKV